jgi:hypothetical protein
MTRDTVLRLVVGGLAAVAIAWLAMSTEWVEVEVKTPPRGEAARNPHYALELLAVQLGARVDKRSSLDTMPPPGARLVLSSFHWALFPDRVQRLREWVHAGGHLIVPAGLLDEPELDWVALELETHEERNEGRGKRRPRQESGCRELAAPAVPAPAVAAPAVPGAAPDAAAAPLPPAPAESVRVCISPYPMELQPRAGTAPQWLLQGPAGVEFARVAAGRGSVTVYGPWTLMHNGDLLRADHAVVAVQAMQLERGGLIWLVAEESREQLLLWTWRHGWVAVLLALAAALAWLWRSAVRFGPVGAVPPRERRSMKEQVAGTGAFLRHNAPQALHAAQVRALHEMGRARMPGYAALPDGSRIDAIAKATGLDAAALRQAVQPRGHTAHNLPAALELMEAARRRLERYIPQRPS